MTNRDYGPNHRQLRADWQQLLNRGTLVICRRCHQPILPNDPWDLGHTTDIALGGTGGPRRPEHANCNRAAGQALTTYTPPSRNW